MWVKRFEDQLVEDGGHDWPILELVGSYADDCLSLLDLRMAEVVRWRRS